MTYMIILGCYGAAPFEQPGLPISSMVHGSDERRPDRACDAFEAKPMGACRLTDQHGRNR